MRQFPVEHAGQLRILRQQIAQPVIAMVEHRLHPVGHILAQPAQAQRDDRPVAARFLELFGQAFDTLGVVQFGHVSRQTGARKRVDSRQIACHVAQQPARIVHREDRPRIGRAGQCAHHEAAADPVARLQADQHLGRGYARGMRRTDNRRFAVMTKGAALHESEARRAAKDEILSAAAEPPAFHGCPTGQPPHPFGRRHAGTRQRLGQSLLERPRAFDLSHGHICADKRRVAQARTSCGVRTLSVHQSPIRGDHSMRLPSNAHVAIVDGENFTVMRNTGQPLEPKLGSAEKPDLSATNYSAGVKHQDNAGQQLGRTDLEELAHGAAATEWLNAKAIAGDISDILVIADPKTLGEMRRHYHGELKKRLVGEIDKTMTGEPTDRIEQAIANA